MKRTELTHGWRLGQMEPGIDLDWEGIENALGEEGSPGWYDVAQMPATVHEVLISHKIIQEPWLPGAAVACRWVAEADWLYALQFDLGGIEGRHYLHFGGLDTIVEIYLNGERIGQHSNMYMPLRVDVTAKLRNKNILVIRFLSVFDASAPTPAPVRTVDGDPARPVRRPKNNYSTYLGPYPYFSRVGVYRAIQLESVGQGSLDECVVDASLSADHGLGTVTVTAKGESAADELLVRVNLLGPDGRMVDSTERAASCRGGLWRTEAVVRAPEPELWWPRGYGSQPLYQVEISLLWRDQAVQTERRTVGFRRITMPEMLHFHANGVPIRLWGGNWVTPDWVSPVWKQERAEHLFELAQNAHFNAFRVWASVETPDDAFYSLADRHGVLIWQDFADLPFASDDTSREICRVESAHLIKRLKHHPSILMWCGGNEATMWNESEFGGPGGPWPGREAAENDVGQVCQTLDPGRFYLPNSPYYGIDANDPKQGDTHGYTNMWYVPGYDDLVFASEDTRISAPPLHSVARFMAPEDLWPAGHSPAHIHGNRYPWPESWQPYTTSTSWRKTGPVEQYYDAASAADNVYRLGMASAQYYRETIERQRRGRPSGSASTDRICGGYLVWKFNDSWPQIYSGKVDYFLEPYIAYYAIRNAYAPVLLSLDVGTYVWLWLTNDSRKTVSATAKVQLFHLYENRVVKEIQRDVSVGPGASREIVRLDQAGIGTFHRDHILHATLTDHEGQIISRTVALADIERNVVFPDARLAMRQEGDLLCITTDQFARSVMLEGDADGDPFGWFFEDNWFDLVPGETKRVRVLGHHRLGRITARPWYSPHAAIVGWRR